MSTPKFMPTSQKANPNAKSMNQGTSVGGGSRPNGATKVYTQSSAPKNPQKIRG